MGRVLVKSALPGKVLVKFDDDYEYAYDANNNIVLVQSPKSRGRPATRGERVASVVGNVAGVGRSLLQPANTFSQFLSNLRTGAQLGGQDVRGLYRNFLETRGARRRAENRQAAADRNERQDALYNQAVRSGQIKVQGPRFGGTSRQQRQNALADLRAAQDTDGQRRKEMQELGAQVYRDAQPTGQDGSTFYGNMQQLISQIPQQLQQNRIDSVPSMTLDLPPVTQVREANGTPIGNVGDAEMNNIFNSIKIPQQGYQSAANEEINGTPAPNTTVPITKPEEEEPAEEEEVDMSDNANPNAKPNEMAMLDALRAKLGAGP